MIRITIRTENAAFSEGQYNAEVAGILYELANKIAQHRTMPDTLHDCNGNTVGSVTLTGKDRP